ncbi:hepatocyte growth factor receptor-like isoform X2 [Acanthaster planci]|uniref:Hepatocyte growth factor receptor n=1 Tax=Acanthaster planci TaxID=133434 RepID=A0A8B7Z161_ACAPL|nr:hepatocyte growth factor receptor-like isoform X2 [Acanthaster planci]
MYKMAAPRSRLACVEKEPVIPAKQFSGSRYSERIMAEAFMYTLPALRTCPFPFLHSGRVSSALSIIILLCLVLPSCALNQRLVDKLLHFSSPEADLQNFVIREDTGEIYLGGTNKLYNLFSNLTKKLKLDTRVEGITHFCPAVTNCPQLQGDNINRLLQIDYGNNLTVSCGSAFAGTCALLDLNNFTKVVDWPTSAFETDGALTEDSLTLGETVVSFYAPFQIGNDGPETQALYVGATYNSDALYSNIGQHAASAKKLVETNSGEWHFSFAYRDVDYHRNSSIDIRPRYRNNYKIKYISGFNSGGFNYFTTVQRTEIDSNRYHSRIVRICTKDKSFYSYTEMELICNSQAGNVYNILRAAYVGKAGSNLGFPIGEDILFAIFSPSISMESESGSGMLESDQPGTDSALCVYSMSKINKRIKKGLQECFNGDGTQGLRFLSDDRLCNEAVYRPVDDDFCGTSDLQPIEARKPASAADILRGGGAGKSFTSIAAMPFGDDTIAVVGTKEGHVLKFLLQPLSSSSDSNLHSGFPYKDLDLSNSPILPNMAFDKTRENVYVMSSHEIFKIAVNSCEHHVDCSACVVTHDPNTCGWCGFCSTRSGCLEQSDTLPWQRDSCPPAIYNVVPLAGPLEGGTRVTITGDNLGLTAAGSHPPEVNVAGQPCAVMQQLSEISRIVCITSVVSSPVTGPIVAKVVLYGDNLSYKVNGTVSTEKRINFTYVDPVITNIEPRYGRQSGGTILTITGSGMNAGNDISVTVLGRACYVKSANMTTLICATTSSTVTESGKVEVRIDGIIRSSHQQFTYVSDPTLRTFTPNKAVVNGGQTVSVFGKNLNFVQVAKMKITIRREDTSVEAPEYSVECSISEEYLQCLSPNISQSASGITSIEPITAEIVFFLDGRPTELSATGSDTSEFLFYPNPVFDPFSGDNNVIVVKEGSSTLTIMGTDLNLALEASDIKVTVGGRECKVTDLKADELTCEIPDMSGAVEDSPGYKVEVRAASTTSMIGYMKIDPRPFPWYAIVIVVLIVVCIIVSVVVWHVRKQSKEEGTDLATGVVTPSVIFRQTSSTGGESAEARVVPAFSRLNNYMRTPTSSSESAFAGIPDENRPLLETINKDLAMQISEVLVNEDNLKQGDIVGQGHFGCVYQGRIWQDGTSFAVAIKSLLRGGKEEIINFLREGIMMKDFKHPHVLELIGVCINSNNMPLVVLPFMKHGDVLTYIRDPKNELTARDLLEFCRQVAEGMAYLASQKFIHRDLASRNCMLDDNLRVKIADFGLSRDIYERDYYSAKDKTAKLPVRWMALESLERNVYNTKTDVWSFGVVMWEFLTRGMTPYPSVDNWDICTYLQRGRRLQQPMHCPDHVYQIMMNCWSVSPVDRPTFDDLAGQITDILMASVNQESEDHEIYLNVVPSMK